MSVQKKLVNDEVFERKRRSASKTKKNSSSRKKSSVKKTTGRRSSDHKKNNKKINRKENISRSGNMLNENVDSEINMGIELQLIVSLCVMALMTLSNFGLCGSAGRILSSFFFGLFGCVQYVMPIAFFVGISLLLVNDYSTIALKKFFAGFVLLMMISAFVHLIYQPDDISIYDLFAVALQDHATGGIIAGGFAGFLRNYFGVAGAVIIILCIFVLAFIMLVQRSVFEFFKKCVFDIRNYLDVLKNDGKEHPFKERKKRKSFEEMERERQCEDKVRELEEQRKETSRRMSRKKVDSSSSSHAAQSDLHMPTFESSDHVKKKDAVIELHPEMYPFTEVDGRTSPFGHELDFTAFSFNSDKSPDDFARELRENALTREEMEQRVKASARLHAKGVREINDVPDQDFLLDVEEEEHLDQGLIPDVEGKEQPDQGLILDVEAEEESLFGNRIVDVEMEEEQPNQGLTLNAEKEEESTDTNRMMDVEAAEKEDLKEKIEDHLSYDSKKATENSEEGYETEHTADEVINSADMQDVVIHKETQKKDLQSSGTDSIRQSIKKFAVRDAEGEEYHIPPLSLLSKGEDQSQVNYDDALRRTAQKLQDTLRSFGVNVKMTDISFGPAVTRYEMVPEQGTKVSKIVSLTDDIKLNLAAEDIRIEAPIPGKSAIGIEVPNKTVFTVHFRGLIDTPKFRNFKSKLAFAVGKDIGGQPVISDIAKMPHLLIAGATGSGKSVCINTLIMSILYKASPEEVKLILIDPKMVELSIYNGIPHLLIPVVTDPKKASGALNWAVAEMTDRYNKFTNYGVRNMEGYNEKVKQVLATGEADPEKLKPLPQILVIIDELADLMMVASGEVEDAIVRLSQLARAAGIHLVIATQRPSVNVITGLIKANVPSRIAFAVSSGVDSRTIIDMNGAEKLLGKGDMLFYPAGSSKPSRVQGAFISDDEILSVVDFLKENEKMAVYDEKVTESIENKIVNQATTKDRDEYFEDAARFIIEKDKASIGMLQRMFKIGFNRAARIMDQLADAGVVGPEEGTKPRKILMGPEQLEQYLDTYL